MTTQQILSTLSSLQDELNQADWLETEPLRNQIQEVLSLINSSSSSFSNQGQADPRKLSMIASAIRNTDSLNSLIGVTASELKKALNVSRAIVYRFVDNTSGVVAAEALTRGFTPMMGETISIEGFGLDGGDLSRPMLHKQQIANVERANLTPYQLQIMERYQVKATACVPLESTDGIWGLLVVQECRQEKAWSHEEMALLDGVSQEMLVQLQVANIRDQLQKKGAADLVMSQISNKILESQDINSIFEYVCNSLRNFLKCDRVALYQFKENWSGEFIVESMASGWVSLLEAQRNNPAIVENVNSCSVQDLAGKSQLTNRSTDTYIRASHGKIFEHSKLYRVCEDVYNSGFSDCYIKVLESYEAKAYIIAAIYRNNELWGLIAAYQNGEARKWSSEEIKLIVEVGKQLKSAIRQTDLQNQLEQKAIREQTISSIVQQIRQSTDLSLIFNNTCREMRMFLKADRVAIFKFDPASDYNIGECVAEDVLNQYVAAIKMTVEDHCFASKYVDKRQMWVSAIPDIQSADIKNCYKAVLGKFQVRANLALPLFLGEQLWGLFCIHQCDAPRQWQQGEIEFAQQISLQLNIALQQRQYFEKLEAKNQSLAQAAAQEKALARAIELIQKAKNNESIFRNILPIFRETLECDRITVYKFFPDWGGEYIAESVGSGWKPLVGDEVKTVWKDTHLQETKGGRYKNGENYVVNNIYEMGHHKCHTDLLEQFQVKAYMLAPIFAGEKLWGIICAYQNDNFRTWKENEINLLTQLGIQLGVGIQQSKYIKEVEATANAEKTLNLISNKIRQAKDVSKIFETVVSDVRNLLKCDRVTIMKFNFDGDWNQECLAESVSKKWMPWNTANNNRLFHDDHIHKVRDKLYLQGKPIVTDDIYLPDYPECYVQVLEEGQVKALINAAIYVKGELWGWLGIFQNDDVRHWQDYEIAISDKLARQVGLGIEQVQYFEELEVKNQSLVQAAAQEKALARAIDQIREAKDIDSIFRNILPSMRGVLNCDRLTVYKFLPDWGGEYIAEALVSKEWEPWVGVELKTVWKDTHLQETKGGRYAKGETFVVNNAYQMGHSQCHVDILAQFKIKSYILAPIFIKEKLWGIICAYEHGEFRTWKQNEANLVTQLGSQLGLAIQQSKYLQEVVQTANAEKTLVTISNKIRQARKLDAIFDTTVFETRNLFKCDRVTIMKFNFEGEWNQECLAESVGTGWMAWNSPNKNKLFHDDHIHQVREQLYRQGQPIVTDDIYVPDYPECYVEVLEKGQVKALINAAIYVHGKLWGWLGIFQNDDVRQWQNYEVSIADKLARQIGLGIEQVQYFAELESKNQSLAEVAAQEKTLGQAIDKIRDARDTETLFRNVLSYIRGMLACDRLTVYKFLPDWGGEYIAESVVSNQWKPWVGVDLKTVWKDTHLQDTKGGRYAKGETFVVNNAYEMGHSQCHVDILAQFQIKSYILAPIFVKQKLWGIICAYEHGEFRTWKQSEANLITQLGSQLGIGIQQSKYIQEVVQTANADETLVTISDKIRQARKLDAVFDTVVFETRNLLKCDRVTIMKFNFDGDWNQECLAESVGKDWMAWNSPNKNKLFHDDHIHEVQDKLYRQGEPIVTDDIYVPDYPKCYVEVLEKAQVKALINAAIYVDGKLWGWLGIFQNDDVRQWQDYEVNIADKLARQVGLGIEQVQYFAELEAKNQSLAEAAAQEKALAETIDKIRQANDIDAVFRNVLSNIRGVLNCDRLAVYKFLPDWGGVFTAESVISNDWEPWVGVDIQTVWKDTYLQETKGGRYAKGETFVVNHAYEMGHSQCHVDILAQFKIKSYILAPIFVDRQLWGILCAYEHGEFRTWKQNEVNLVSQLGSQLGIGIQQSRYVKQLIQTSKADQTLAIISDRIRQARKLNTIFDSIVFDARSLLKCDRATIMKFNFEGDWNQECLAESVGQEWMAWNTSSNNKLFHDDHIHEVREKLYRQGQPIVTDDIYIPDYPECYVEVLEKAQVKALINAAIYVNGKLWGWLGIFQNDDVRHWQDYEVNIADKLARQIGLGIEQVQYFKELEVKNQSLAQAAIQEKALARAIDKISQAQDLDNIFRIVLPDIRNIIKCDRLAIYQFLPDWSGEFIAESVGSDWVPLVNKSKNLKTTWEDTYLQETQGGRYKDGETLVVDNVNTVGFSQCHLDLLEQFQMKAHILAPIFVGKKLWGILGAYQNTGARHWQTNEVDLINRLASQLGLGVQQAEFLTQVQQQEKQLQASAEREKTAREKLQMEALQMLRALQPSFQGDLTVRAPLSESELGTIADGYNTTMTSLRELVKQVKETAVKVGETSEQSSLSVNQLTTQAQKQVIQMNKALKQLRVMVKSTEAVANDAQKVGQAVQEANKTVNAGDSLMERTVDEMLEIRETVSQTAKKIKRLGEASQKISKVVNLIENFATQTNLLALNAAIEATRAGEYGKGFAVVADEVRSLAYQSANATTEIERFVQDIQKEINEVTETMEVGISQVVKGSDLVDETRNSLNAIVSATNQISQLVAGITQTTTSQSEQSEMLTTAMTEVSQVAQKTSESSTQISASFSKLLTTSQELQTSVSKFKVD